MEQSDLVFQKLKAKETSNYTQKVSEESEDIIKKKGKNTRT